MGIIRLNEMQNKVYKAKSVVKQGDFVMISKKKTEERIDTNDPKVIRTRDINETWEDIINTGWISNKQYPLGPFENIKNIWKNRPCFVVGSGPDLTTFIGKIGWDFLSDKCTIGINHVIESWDKFKWFIFLDRRFLKKTTYDLRCFRGRIFAQNNTGISNFSRRITRFRCRPSGSKPTMNVQKGLYSNRFSGLCALHLAVLSGANPIFLIGFGMGKNGNENKFHFRDKYQGVGQRPKEQFKKYQRTYRAFKKFQDWAPSIIHVTEGESLANFRKMTFSTLKKKFKSITPVELLNVNKSVELPYVNKGVEPKIVHLSFSNDVNIHADITRSIMKECYGRHSLSTFENIPNADLYITEHFISTNKFVQNFKYKRKTINIVHSMNCYPQGNFLCNIALTMAWKNILKRKGVSNIRVIRGGIDLEPYKNIKPTKNRVFGRITRWSPGKIPWWWNRLVQNIFAHDENIKCLMFIDNRNRARKLLDHKRMIYDYSCKINNFKGDWLKKLRVYVHANGSFKETMSHAVIEAMATGLPVIYLGEPAVSEVVGNAGIRVQNEEQLKNQIIKFLYDDQLFNSYSELSRKRAQLYDIKNTVKQFDILIKEICK
jgi:glycosyltransferase involved in cell wall biosynthesis